MWKIAFRTLVLGTLAFGCDGSLTGDGDPANNASNNQTNGSNNGSNNTIVMCDPSTNGPAEPLTDADAATAASLDLVDRQVAGRVRLRAGSGHVRRHRGRGAGLV